MRKYVIVVGFTTQLKVFGPFNSQKEAYEWAKEKAFDMSFVIAPIEEK